MFVAPCVLSSAALRLAARPEPGCHRPQVEKSKGVPDLEIGSCRKLFLNSPVPKYRTQKNARDATMRPARSKLGFTD